MILFSRSSPVAKEILPVEQTSPDPSHWLTSHDIVDCQRLDSERRTHWGILGILPAKVVEPMVALCLAQIQHLIAYLVTSTDHLTLCS
jgi:hypothetical protein